MALYTKQTEKLYKVALWAGNIVLMLVAVVVSLIYAYHVRTSQIEVKQADFISTVESMKSVSQNYLDSERGYVENWAFYINDRQMTREEALDFLRSINTNPGRYVHIVDMENFDAWSASYPAGHDEIDTYHRFQGELKDWEQLMLDAMWEMYNGTAPKFTVVGRYQLDETVSPAVSVGARITLQTEDGTKDFLLLRAIPTNVLQKTWVFPAEYQSAEVGIMTTKGGYVIQSPSMKSISFPEYIRGYNFQDDYNKVDSFQKELESTDHGVLCYKNFRNEDCLWYYSSFGGNSNLDILGVIRLDELQPENGTWLIVVLICGTLAALVLLDGLYLRQVNQRLRRTAKLAQEASEAKTQFLSSMSHDIRTPMNAVLGMMSIAKSHVQDPEYVTQCLDKAMTSGKRLLTLINDVLDISKIESGQFVLTPSEVLVEKFFKELDDMLALQIREKNLHFTIQKDALPHPVVLADPIRLNQIYMNLLSNAVKYTPDGGSITMRFGEEPAEADKKLTCLVFCVSDTGIGMTPEYQDRMYQSFSREINTQVNRTLGSGLGLAIVRQMVDLMGGTITCESEVEKGTTFTVRLNLPIVDQQPVTKQEGHLEDDDVRGLHLLVAEDNELNWEVIEILLEEFGVTCERVENGRLCIEQLLANPAGTYDAILMDVQMPEMNGLEASQRIRNLDEAALRNIPVIAMTADAFAEDVQACISSGMNGHMAKPIDTIVLLNYLKKIKNKMF